MTLPLARLACTDGDPACDLDRVAGQCTIDLAACAAVADARLPLCAPDAPGGVLATVRGGADPTAVQSGLNAALAPLTPGSCSTAVPVVIPLGAKSRAHAKVKSLASLPTGTDRDVLKLTCTAAP